MLNVEGRHPSIAHFGPLFAYDHLPLFLQSVSKLFCDVGNELLGRLNDGQELAEGLRKLVEAKDCAVRQAVIDHSIEGATAPKG